MKVSTSDLIAYFCEYLKTHTYIKSRNIAIAYLIDFRKSRNIAIAYLIDFRKSNHINNDIPKLTQNFSRFLGITHKLSLITKYNSSVYKAIKPINYTALEQEILVKFKPRNFTIGAKVSKEFIL